MKDYETFLMSKSVIDKPSGFDSNSISDLLFPFQKDITRWALKRGRAALFEDCGLGKTPQQLEWARQVCAYTGGNVLILAPLAVSWQTFREGEKFGIGVTVCRSQEDVLPGVNITNYESLHKFNCKSFAGVVLDESSILKSYMGKVKNQIIQEFRDTQYKLCCTATPAPNDHLELGNHAEFLGIMDSNEMISRWFINDSMSFGNYRLKQHAEKDFWRWVASWAVCISKPSDLNYDDGEFILPELKIHEHLVEVDHTQSAGGWLFRGSSLSATDLHQEMRLTSESRAEQAAELIGEYSKDFWVLWCNTNYEADDLNRRIPDSFEVRGSQSIEAKEITLNKFSQREIKRLITKPSIAGFGMNWQHCHHMAFVGLSYSYEQLYQALRRSWRFGQKQAVNAHIIIAESEGSVLKTIKEKQALHVQMKEEMTAAMRENQLENIHGVRKLKMEVNSKQAFFGNWEMRLGDCVEETQKIADNSVHFTIFSPPFSNLYIYSDSLRDMGNSLDDEEFLKHFEFLIPELHRVTLQGRLCSIHCKDLPRYRGRDGSAGLKDFPGMLIRLFEKHGWTYHSRVTIWKDPVIEMQRTKNHGLLYKNFKVRSEVCRQGMADFLVTFRKWEGVEVTQSIEPVVHSPSDYPLESWQRWASPVWSDIDQTNVLNYQIAKENSDEKHICPLQLGVIERAVELWTNPNDLVFSPFAGIGSEGYQSILLGRRFIGIELKESYFNQACKNLKRAEQEVRQRNGTLFNDLPDTSRDSTLPAEA